MSMLEDYFTNLHAYMHPRDNRMNKETVAVVVPKASENYIPEYSLKYAAQVLQERCHDESKRAGWWKPGDIENPLTFSNKLMLIVSEVSEAMEGDRKSLPDDKLPHRAMREVELADAVIRIFDLAGAYNMDLAGAIVEKIEFNAQRADHKPEARAAQHGKKY